MKTQKRGKFHTKQPGFAGPMLQLWRHGPVFGKRSVTAREVDDAFIAGSYNEPEGSLLRRFAEAILQWAPDAKPGDARSLCLRRDITGDGYRLRYRYGKWRVFAPGEVESLAFDETVSLGGDDVPPLPPLPPGTPAWKMFGPVATSPHAPPRPPELPPEPEMSDDEFDSFDWDEIDDAAEREGAAVRPAWETSKPASGEGDEGDERPGGVVGQDFASGLATG